ncbi:MAG: hypothetical protein ACRDS0_24440 [Pseudonocardiaceae bacterium]
MLPRTCTAVVSPSSTARLPAADPTAMVSNSATPWLVERMVAHTVETFGRLDVAHNNAGVPGPYQPLWEYSEADFAAGPGG